MEKIGFKFTIMEKIFRYEQVVNKVESLIETLQLKPGDKIPSVRHVSKQLGVSLTTVFQAYGILEARGVILSRPRSGYYISFPGKQGSNIPGDHWETYIALPSKVEINQMATVLMKNSRERGAVNFSILAPVNEFLPIVKLNKAVQGSLKEVHSYNFQYPLVEGHQRLRKQISIRSMKWENTVGQDRILITNGCMEAINLCLDAVTSKGDIVAVESPTYHGILQSLESRGLKALEIKTDPLTGIDLQALELALESNEVSVCVFMPLCSNPSGASMPEKNIRELVRILENRNVPLIEDDSLGELLYGSIQHLPAKAFDATGNVLYCSSFSKSLAPGFRIGWVSGGRFQKDIEKLKFGANISTNGVLQDAIGRYLETGHYEGHLRKMRIALQIQVARYTAAVHDFFPDGIRFTSPAGGFSLWIELPCSVDALQYQKAVLELGIGICPGHIFSVSGRYDSCIRINCCPIWTPKMEAAIKKMGELAKKSVADPGYLNVS